MEERAVRKALPEPPLVSVVIPTFNRPEYLRIALRSALAQTLADIEVIVQDNASPTDPIEVVTSFGDARTAYFRHQEPVSQSANVISACARARGKYVAILGDDDVWQPNFLAALVAPLERDPELVLAFCDHLMIDSQGIVHRRETQRVTRAYRRHRLAEGVHRPFDEIALVSRSICLFSAAVVRRAAIDWSSIPLDLGFGPIDYYIAYLAARTGKGCYYLRQPLASYRQHAGALSSARMQPHERMARARYAMTYWRRLLADRDLKGSSRYFEMKLGYNVIALILSLLKAGEWRRALDELRHHWAEGLLRPRIFAYHLLYAMRLHRLRA